MDGLLIVDKPAGPTSHDIVQEVKRLLGAKKVGHLGTLDPEATGVLTLMVNQATKAASKFGKDVKVYEFDLVLGSATDTDDDTGQVIKKARKPAKAYKKVSSILSEFTGKLSQVPPLYSAIKVKGKPLYKKARKGQKIEPKPREVTVHNLAILSGVGGVEARDRIRMRMTCSSGTYVRAICRDIGEKLGCYGHAARIRRLQSGPFRLDHAVVFGKFRSLDPEQRPKMIKSLTSFV